MTPLESGRLLAPHQTRTWVDRPSKRPLGDAIVRGGWAADACCTSMSIGLDMVGFCSARRRRKGNLNWERCRLWWNSRNGRANGRSEGNRRSKRREAS
jgi:hypothetical protein